MTVLIVEGCNGLGKTTLIKEVGRFVKLPRLKPFDILAYSHWDADGADTRLLKGLGVPFNSIAEDMFIADFVGRFNLDVALDRSVPSAIICGVGNPTLADEALDLWRRLLVGCGVLYVWLDGSGLTSEARAAGRYPGDEEFYRQRDQFWALYQKIKFPKITINAEDPAEGNTYEVLKKIGQL